MRVPWSPALVVKVRAILERHTDMAEALVEIGQAMGGPITRQAVDDALRKYGLQAPGKYLKQKPSPRDAMAAYLQHDTEPGMPAVRPDVLLPPPPEVDEIPIEIDDPFPEECDSGTTLPALDPSHETLSKLVALAKKASKRGGSLTLEAVCDELRITPREARDLTERAVAQGYHVAIHDGQLDFRAPEPADHKEVLVDSPHVELGDEIVIGVVSDPHFASKHHEGDAIRRHVEWLYESGARYFFNPGDWVAGGYRFLKYEVTCTGIADQSRLATDFVKECGPEINWLTIAGNHCESFDVGINAAQMIENQLRADGWTNFRYMGARGALVRLFNTRFAMHHPGGGLAYAVSYKLQKYVDEQPLHRRAQFLFTGHTHQALYLPRGGCHSFLCGTFENGDSSFGRMLGGDVRVGGWLIRYRLDSRGEVGTVNMEFRSQPHRNMQFVQVPA